MSSRNLNVFPTSNLMLGRVGALESHPIRKLYDAGVRVTVNSDDALIFGRTVFGGIPRSLSRRFIQSLRSWTKSGLTD